MNDNFIKNPKEPSIEEYLRAPLEDIIGRMKANPTGMRSIDPFFEKIIDFKIAEENQKTNKKLVCATWAMVFVTIIINILIFVFKIIK